MLRGANAASEAVVPARRRQGSGSATSSQAFVEPDIANSRLASKPEGMRENVENWFWDKLTYFL